MLIMKNNIYRMKLSPKYVKFQFENKVSTYIVAFRSSIELHIATLLGYKGKRTQSKTGLDKVLTYTWEKHNYDLLV